MEQMVSYHGDPAIKQKYVDRFAAHRAADQVIQGIGFDNGRGCFVGCTLHEYNHNRAPIELGWPIWLARLADAVFEGLSESEAPQFGTDLLNAVPVGVDLEPIRHMLAIMRINRLIDLQRGNAEKFCDDVGAAIAGSIAALETVRRCHEAEIGGDHCDWSAALSAARSAAWSAESAAWSAAESAWSAAESAAWSAESAARSAWSAARSAESAARSAESAAWSAAESAAWSAAESAESAAFQQERNNLLVLCILAKAAA